MNRSWATLACCIQLVYSVYRFAGLLRKSTRPLGNQCVPASDTGDFSFWSGFNFDYTSDVHYIWLFSPECMHFGPLSSVEKTVLADDDVDELHIGLTVHLLYSRLSSKPAGGNHQDENYIFVSIICQISLNYRRVRMFYFNQICSWLGFLSVIRIRVEDTHSTPGSHN
jgi:hypothetical protein